MMVRLETQLTHIPPRSGLADAIRYAPTRWSSPCCFLDDGRVELDTNTVERAIRPIALGRKNHLFAEFQWRCGPLGDGLFPHHHGKTQ